MTQATASKQICKLSIRVEEAVRQDVKAVASLSGMNIEEWLKSLIRGELERMGPALAALRSASSR